MIIIMSVAKSYLELVSSPASSRPSCVRVSWTLSAWEPSLSSRLGWWLMEILKLSAWSQHYLLVACFDDIDDVDGDDDDNNETWQQSHCKSQQYSFCTLLPYKSGMWNIDDQYMTIQRLSNWAIKQQQCLHPILLRYQAKQRLYSGLRANLSMGGKEYYFESSGALFKTKKTGF